MSCWVLGVHDDRERVRLLLLSVSTARMRLVWRVLTPINVAAWSTVICSASKLLRTCSLVCSFCVNVTFSIM